jgi:antitoxin component YwqK of YwqJK toxin-antitoxin module
MIKIFNQKYKELSIVKVKILVRKYNRIGQLSSEIKVISFESYFDNGYLSEKIEFYGDEKSIKSKYKFETDKKVLLKTHYSLDGKIEYKELWRFDKKDRLIEEGKFHYNYANSLGKPVLGRNWTGQYDENGNLIFSIQYSHGKEVEEALAFKYDIEGKLIEKTADDYKWEYLYENGLQTKILRKQLFLKGQIDYRWDLIYNNENQLIDKTRYLNNSIDYIQQWDYENNNKIMEKDIEFVDNERHESCSFFDYTSDNRILSERNDTITTNYKYNDNKELIEITSFYNNGQVLSKELFVWIESGLLWEHHENKLDDIPKQITIYEYQKGNV